MAGGKTRKPILPSGGRNISGHMWAWGRALNDAIGAAQVEKNKLLDESKDAREKLNKKIKAATGSEKKLLQAELKALSVSARLTDIDARTAWCITIHTFGDLGFYKSAAELATQMKVTENTADESLRRIFRAGFLERIPHTKADYSHGGRPANNYRIPDVFPSVGGGNELPATAGETDIQDQGVSPSYEGGVFPGTAGEDSPSCEGTIMKERKSEGAGAPSGAPQAPFQDDPPLVENDQNHNDQIGDPGDLGAHECPPSPDPETFPPNFEPDPADCVIPEPEDAKTEPGWVIDVRREADENCPHEIITAQSEPGLPDFEVGDDDDDDEPDAKTVVEWSFRFNNIAGQVAEELGWDKGPRGLIDFVALGGINSKVTREKFFKACAKAFAVAPSAWVPAVRYLRHELRGIVEVDQHEWVDKEIAAIVNGVASVAPPKLAALVPAGRWWRANHG